MNDGFDNALYLVDHLTRMAQFLTCTKSVASKETTSLFLQGVLKLHGLRQVFVNDRDPKLVNGIL
jgi:hypothetical protein